MLVAIFVAVKACVTFRTLRWAFEDIVNSREAARVRRRVRLKQCRDKKCGVMVKVRDVDASFRVNANLYVWFPYSSRRRHVRRLQY